MSCRSLFVKTLCHGLFWLGFCHCIHDGMLPFCETLLYAILSHTLCTAWPTMVDAAVTRIARVLTKRARGSKPCRRIKGRRYKPCRSRRRQRRRKNAWTRLWHWSRKLRNRLAHALHGNGPEPTDASSNSGTASGENTATEQPIASYTVEERAQQLKRVPVDIPGDGWCLLHAVSWYLERHESHEPEWSVRKAADTYVQALEFLVQQFDGPSAADINIACMPDQPAELELHRRFLVRRGILLPDELPQGLLVLWSKLTAVLEMPNMLDSIHHGTSVEVWALTKAFGFEVHGVQTWMPTTGLQRWSESQTQKRCGWPNCTRTPCTWCINPWVTPDTTACCGKIGHLFRYGSQHHGCRYGTGMGQEHCNSTWV